MTLFSGVAEEVKELLKEQPTYQHLPYLYFEAKKARTILELGLRKGYSTRSLLYGLRDGKQGHLWSIDWGKNPETPKTVEHIVRSNLAEYFTWIKRDVTSIPDSWFKNHKMDLVFPDVPPAHRKIFLNKPLLSLSKGSRLFIICLSDAPEKSEFVYSLDTNKYHYEMIPSKKGILNKGAVIITKDVDD